jgi:hypothetical protein
MRLLHVIPAVLSVALSRQRCPRGSELRRLKARCSLTAEGPCLAKNSWLFQQNHFSILAAARNQTLTFFEGG